MALDKRRNFRDLKEDDRLRIIAAIKWLKEHEIGGAPSSTGGRYQQYVNWYSDNTKVDYLEKFDYTWSVPLADIVDSDRVISIEFDSLDPVTPKENILVKDFLNFQTFLNELFAHSLDSFLSGQVIGHPTPNIPSEVACFTVSSDGTDINVTCPNCPFVLTNITVQKNGSNDTISFMQTTRTTDVQWQVSPMDIARKGPAYLPWNRTFLRLFEMDLKTADQALGGNGKIALPYWDWSVDNAASGQFGYLWKDEDFLFGGDGNESNANKLETGPFNGSSWILYSGPTPHITRSLGRAEIDGMKNPWTMPTKTDEDELISKDQNDKAYDVYPFNESSSAYSFRNQLEGWFGVYNNDSKEQKTQMANAVHLWIGGTMANFRYAVNDPIFFLHMANVDRMWTNWQKKKIAPNMQYPVHGPLPGCRLTDEMLPWASAVSYSNPITVENVMDSEEFPGGALGDGYKYK